MNFAEYANKDIDEVFKKLKTSRRGLSEDEAAERLKIGGFNEIKEKENGLFKIFLRQLKSPFFYLLFIASFIAFLIGEWIDGLVILLFVLLNVFLGFIQEARAEQAVAALKRYIPSKARVIRGDDEKIIDKKNLVRGDIVLLEAGDIAPVDLRVIEAANFLVDESVLSGESAPVLKTGQTAPEAKEIFEAKNIIFAGTSAVSGEAMATVIGTGQDTELGEIAGLVLGITRESVYEKNLFKFSRLILRIVVITIVVIFLANLLIKGTANFFEFLIFSIALIVSIIPEALPAVVTFSLSRGAMKMAKEKVVVKRLSAIEDLGDIEVLCSDKTGTLTENKLRLANVFSSEKDKCLLYGILSSSYAVEKIESTVNPFDTAIWEGSPLKIRDSIKNYKAISEIPFGPERLRNSVLLEDGEKRKILIVKGAPEIILNLSEKFGKNQTRESVMEKIKKEGEEGKRTLAIGFKELSKGQKRISADDENSLVFLGFYSFVDPLKNTAKEAIQLAKKLGVEIKIITGDSREIAGYIGKEAGLIDKAENVISGKELEMLAENEFERKCLEFSVFARISPKTKYKIVEALQKKCEVGFLGEGVNDAPALKLANVAIAVPSAADVSREASDIVMLQKDLKVIVDGIRNGRDVFSNINKYLKLTITSNFGNFYSIATISLLIPYLPMLPAQILLVNLLSDFPLIAVATDRIDVEELKKPKMFQLNNMIFLIILLALTSTVFDFIFFGIFRKVQPGLLQTLWFTESILTEIFLVFSVRTSHFFLKAKFPSLPLIILSFLAASAAIIFPFTKFGQETFHFVSPPLTSLFIVLSLVIIYFFISEIVKLLYFRYRRNYNSSRN